LHARARSGLVQRGEPFRVREHGVELLDEPIGRQAAVRLTEVHRAARGDDSDAELTRGLERRLDQAVLAAREDVVVVEDGAAARERKLGESGAGRRVLGLGVDQGPDGIELLQPGEEIGLLRPRPGQRLEQVVVGVDQRRGDYCAGEVLARLGRLAGADLRDESVLDPDPPSGELSPRVVHRDDVRVGEDGHSTSSGTSSKRSTSTRPWSVIFRLGITESARNDIVRNGVAPPQPSRSAASVQARLRSTTSASGRSASSPPTGSGNSASTSPLSTATMPPPSSARRSTTRVISASFMPTTTRLWASWATVEPRAPRSRPKPRAKPRPIRPV